MYDSPIEYCAVCRQMVTLAQSFSECQRRHVCDEGVACPLRDYFSALDDGSEQRRDKPPRE